MQLNQVTGKNLDQLKRESDVANRAFFKEMLARAKTENALYAVLVGVMADTARAQRISEGNASPDQIHDLVVDIGMLCLRALELAALDRKQPDPPDVALMQDPPLDTLDTPALEAVVETRLLMSLLRAGTKK